MSTNVTEKVLDLVMISGKTKQPNDNMIGWKLISAEPTKLEVDLEFREPLEVSQGDIPDKLLI